MECFQTSFLIITAAMVGGALVSLVLVWRTRDFYRGDIYAKSSGTEWWWSGRVMVARRRRSSGRARRAVEVE